MIRLLYGNEAVVFVQVDLFLALAKLHKPDPELMSDVRTQVLDDLDPDVLIAWLLPLVELVVDAANSFFVFLEVLVEFAVLRGRD